MTQKRRIGLVLAMALVFGGAAALMAVRYVSQLPPQLVAAPTRQVVVAMEDLPVGTLVKPEHVRLVRWPADALPAGYYASAGDVVGRGLVAPVRVNEPLMAGKLAGKGEGAGLPPLIPDGMRAISVNANQVIAVAGFVTPNSRVDVLLTIEKDGQPVTRVFMQNMTVLAVNQSIVEDEEGKPMRVSIVTFLVNPDQAEKITLATQEGKLQLALRNRADVEETTTRGARLADLGGSARGGGGGSAPETRSVSSTPGDAAQQERGIVIETIRGGQRTLQTFSNGNP